MHMMFESVMSDWTLSQPILYDSTMIQAAEAIAKSAETDPLAAEEQHPEHDDWATRDTWEQAGDQHQHQHQHITSRMTTRTSKAAGLGLSQR